MLTSERTGVFNPSCVWMSNNKADSRRVLPHTNSETTQQWHHHQGGNTAYSVAGSLPTLILDRVGRGLIWSSSLLGTKVPSWVCWRAPGQSSVCHLMSHICKVPRWGWSMESDNLWPHTETTDIRRQIPRPSLATQGYVLFQHLKKAI